MTIPSRFFLLAALAMIALPAAAQSPIGTWRTIDDETGEAKSHIEIYQTQNGQLEGKIVRLLQGDGTCQGCEGQYAGKPMAGVVVLRGLKFDGDGEWDGGKITDPKKDKTYSAEIKLDGNDRLEVRGYVGKGIFSIGRTQTWERVDS
jgi:uncharacterized protein (DUF2147 family)